MKSLTLSSYDKARKELSNYLFGIDGVKGVWEYGEVSNPGVSDLDVMVIMDERHVNPSLSFKLQKSNLPDISVEAMAHANLMVVPEGSAEGVFYWDNLKIKNLVTQEKIQQPQLNESHLLHAMVVDWSFERLYRLISFRDKEMTFSHRLGLLKSFAYSVENFIKINQRFTTKDFLELKMKLVELRKTAVSFDLSEAQRKTTELHEEFIDFSEYFHEALFNYFKTINLYGEVEKKFEAKVFQFPDGMKYRFVKERSLLKKTSLSKEIELPIELLNHYFRYISGTGELSKKLLGSIDINDHKQFKSIGCKNYFSFLDQRIAFANKWFEYLKVNGFKFGLFKFGWYLNH